MDTKHTMNTIIQNIDDLLVKNDMSAKELAIKLGKDPSLVSNWRAGRSRPSVEILIDICFIFNCGINDIFPSYLIRDNSTDELDLMLKYKSLLPDDKEEILKIIDFKLDKYHKKNNPQET